MFLLQVEVRFLLEEQAYELSKPALFLIKPNQYHGLNPVDLVKILDIQFQAKDKMLRQSMLRASSCISEEDAEISYLFERIRWEGEQKQPLFRELCSSYLFQILILYLRRSERPAVKDEAPTERKMDGVITDAVSRQALDLIRTQRAQELDLQQIANSLGSSNRSVHQHL